MRKDCTQSPTFYCVDFSWDIFTDFHSMLSQNKTGLFFQSSENFPWWISTSFQVIIIFTVPVLVDKQLLLQFSLTSKNLPQDTPCNQLPDETILDEHWCYESCMTVIHHMISDLKKYMERIQLSLNKCFFLMPVLPCISFPTSRALQLLEATCPKESLCSCNCLGARYMGWFWALK